MAMDPNEIFNISKIQDVTDSFFDATGIPATLVDKGGKILTGSGWQDACTQFHRQHPEAGRLCRESDTTIREGLLSRQRSVIYKCPHGLIDAAAPVIVDGEHVANFFTGQFFFNPPSDNDLLFFERQAEKYGFDKTDYLEAILKVPIIPKHRLASILAFLSKFAELIAALGYVNLQNTRYAQELEQARHKLEKQVADRTQSLQEANLELKKEVEQRKQSENRYRQLIRNSPNILYRLSKKNNTFFITRRVENILGYSPEDVGKNPAIWFNAIHPEDKVLVDQAIAAFWKGIPFKIEYRIKDIKGDWHWFYDRSLDRYSEDNDIILESLVMDITDRVSAEERFQSFFKLMSDIFCIADVRGHFLLINPAATKILGYSEEELLSRPYMDFVHPEDREKTNQVVEEQLEKGETVISFLNRYICKDGSFKWLEWRSYPMAALGLTYASARDVTKQIEVETALEESEIRMRDIFNTIDHAIVVTDPGRNIMNINAATRDMFGYTLKELTGKKADILHVDYSHYTEFGNLIQKAFEHERTAKFEFLGKRKNGEIFPSENSASLLKSETGKMLGIVTVIRDITDRIKREKAMADMLRELERSNAELEQFAYIASHDLQEPLRAIAGFLQLLQNRYADKLDEKGHHYINRSVIAAQRMQTLINDILTLSRVSTKGAPLVLEDLNALLKKAIEEIEVTIRKVDATITAADLPSAPVDGNQIHSLFQNLLLNAIKYAGETKPVIEIGYDETDEKYRFFVRDNGIGIDPNFHERIFFIFQRLHTNSEYPGTGLGLALCKKIIERHGGDIWVDSEPGKGATFYFTLPKTMEPS